MSSDKETREDRKIETALSLIAIEEGYGLPQTTSEVEAYEDRNSKLLSNSGARPTLSQAIDKAQHIRQQGLVLTRVVTDAADSELPMAARNSEGVSEELNERLNKASDIVRQSDSGSE